MPRSITIAGHRTRLVDIALSYLSWKSAANAKLGNIRDGLSEMADNLDTPLSRASGRSQAGLPLFDLGGLLHRSRGENEARIRGLCQTAYLGDHAMVCRALGRYKMFVDTRDVGLASHLMLDGYWEMWVTEVIAGLIRPGMVVADVGANLGYYTMLMADLAGPAGKVHAFEPNPQMVANVERSLSVNGLSGRCEVHRVALGATDGERMAFVIPPHEPKNAYICPITDGVVPEGATALETCRLDGRRDWEEIELAKIDVEGAEELVWAGATGLLEGNKLRTVILEFTPGRYADPAAFLDRVLAPGFALAKICPANGIVDASRADVLGGDPREDVMLLLRR